MNDPGPGLTPEEITKRIRAMGRGLGGSMFRDTLALCGDLQKPISRDGIEVLEDLSYGPDERHLLDVHLPPDTGDGPRPVVIFFHGGGFTGGNKVIKGGLFYGNVVTYFARHGIIGINATHRFAPEFQYPAAALDVGTAVAWAHANIAGHGGDPRRIFVFGHSSGATHAAAYALRADLHPEGGHGLAGAILMSGMYGPNIEADSWRQVAYYGEDQSLYDGMSALGQVGPDPLPVFVAFSELDDFLFQKAGMDLIAEVAERDQACPWFKVLRGHNHMSGILSMDTGDQAIGPDLIAFIKTGIT